MKLLVLAGGFGTRLKGVLKGRPKALADVHGTPFLHYQIESWVSQGVTDMVFLLHYEAGQIITYLEECKQHWPDCQFRWLIEKTPLDTAGAICFCISHLEMDGSFLVVNADTYLSGGLAELWSAPAPAILGVHLEQTGRYGTIAHKDGFVTSLTEKEPAQKASYINAGAYHFTAADFKPWDGMPTSLERTYLPQFIAQRRLRFLVMSLTFIDIGIPSDYKIFCDWQSPNGQGLS